MAREDEGVGFRRASSAAKDATSKRTKRTNSQKNKRLRLRLHERARRGARLRGSARRASVSVRGLRHAVRALGVRGRWKRRRTKPGTSRRKPVDGSPRARRGASSSRRKRKRRKTNAARRVCFLSSVSRRVSRSSADSVRPLRERVPRVRIARPAVGDDCPIDSGGRDDVVFCAFSLKVKKNQSRSMMSVEKTEKELETTVAKTRACRSDDVRRRRSTEDGVGHDVTTSKGAHLEPSEPSSTGRSRSVVPRARSWTRRTSPAWTRCVAPSPAPRPPSRSPGTPRRGARETPRPTCGGACLRLLFRDRAGSRETPRPTRAGRRDKLRDQLGLPPRGHASSVGSGRLPGATRVFVSVADGEESRSRVADSINSVYASSHVTSMYIFFYEYRVTTAVSFRNARFARKRAFRKRRRRRYFSGAGAFAEGTAPGRHSSSTVAVAVLFTQSSRVRVVASPPRRVRGRRLEKMRARWRTFPDPYRDDAADRSKKALTRLSTSSARSCSWCARGCRSRQSWRR